MNSEALFTELDKIVNETDEGNDSSTEKTKNAAKRVRSPRLKLT
jgi:hypothetical protein